MIRFRVLCFERFESRELLATVTLEPIADNTLYESATGNLSNGAGQGLFVGQAGPSAGIRRAVLKFDVAGAIPAGSTIESVTLRMNMSRTPSAASRNIAVHQVLADWGEGTSVAGPGGMGSGEGDGAPAATNDATWRHRFFNTTFWTNAGGDFDSTASATTAVGGLNTYDWTGSGLVADVQEWLTTPSTRFGWLLKAVSETVESSTKKFDSRESGTPPQLIINYSAGNAAPTLNPIADPAAIAEDSGEQTINLSGISAGSGETQLLAISVASSAPGLIPVPQVTYTSPSATGSLRYTPVANQSGAATITVTVRDAGADGTPGNTDDATLSRSFSVTVTPINDPPTLNTIDSPPVILENAGEQVVNLSGISAGLSESQLLIVRASSSNPGLIPDPAVTYVSPAATGSLRYTPVANQTGSAIVTVTVRDAGLDGILDNTDDGTLARQFTVLVNSASAVNQPPSFVAGPNTAGTDEDGELSLAGWATSISPGPAGEELQTVDFLLENDAPGLFSFPPQVDRAGKLTFNPAPNVRGVAHVTVRLKDNGGTANGGVDTSGTQTFEITISKPHVWHNASIPEDVSGDGNVVAGDALDVINYINAFRAGAVPENAAIGPQFLDVQPDNFVAPNDALAVINLINSGAGGEGEATARALAVDQLLELLAAESFSTPGKLKRR